MAEYVFYWGRGGLVKVSVTFWSFWSFKCKGKFRFCHPLFFRNISFKKTFLQPAWIFSLKTGLDVQMLLEKWLSSQTSTPLPPKITNLCMFVCHTAKSTTESSCETTQYSLIPTHEPVMEHSWTNVSYIYFLIYRSLKKRF